MTQRFEFADAWWFRVPLRIVVVSVTVFTLLSLEPALVDGHNPDHLRALAGVCILAAFLVGAAVFTASLGESYIEIRDEVVSVRFESFFGVEFPLRDIVRVQEIDPRPRWRYQWGLATNFHDRVSCSHGGQLVEVELASPCVVKLWPRTLEVSRFWLAARDYRGLIGALEPGNSSAFQAVPAAA